MCQACIVEKMCGEDAEVSILMRLMQLVVDEEEDDVPLEDIIAYAKAIAGEELEQNEESQDEAEEKEETEEEKEEFESSESEDEVMESMDQYQIEVTDYVDLYQQELEMPAEEDQSQEPSQEAEDD